MNQKENRNISLILEEIKNNRKKIKEIDPIISDDFQIGPNGAYEHRGELYKSELSIKRMIKLKRK